MAYYKIDTINGKFTFNGIFCRDLESKNWHYYEIDDGTVIHFRKEHMVAVECDTFENIYKYHAPKEGQPTKSEAIRAKAKELAELIEAECPESRERSVAFTKITMAVMLANAAIARA